MAVFEGRRRGTEREKNLVGFLVDGVHYAVPIPRVREIIRPLTLVAVPEAPPAVLGVVDHRGEVVPVLDVRRSFALPPRAEGQRMTWLVVEVSGRRVALVVDAVTEVFGTSEGQERAAPSLADGALRRGVTAVFGVRERLVFVLDVDLIVRDAHLVDHDAWPLGGAGTSR